MVTRSGRPPGDYAAPVSEIEPHQRPKKEVAPQHIPQEVVPVPIGEVRDFVRDAVRGTSLVNPVTQVLSGWVFFRQYLRFTSVDAAHTRIELDLVEMLSGAEMLLYPQRRAEIHRFFVAIEDEVDRRERWRQRPPTVRTSIQAPTESRGITLPRLGTETPANDTHPDDKQRELGPMSET